MRVLAPTPQPWSERLGFYRIMTWYRYYESGDSSWELYSTKEKCRDQCGLESWCDQVIFRDRACWLSTADPSGACTLMADAWIAWKPNVLNCI